MCMNTLSTAAVDKFSPANWIMRKQGYAGAYNPALDLKIKAEHKLIGGKMKESSTDRRVRTQYNNPKADIAYQPRHSGAPAHAQLNENQLQIAGRRGPGRG